MDSAEQNKKDKSKDKSNSKTFINKINSAYGKKKNKNVPINDDDEAKNIKSVEVDLDNQDIDANEELNSDVCEESSQDSNDKLEKLSKEKQSLEEQLKRKVAEFENYKRRTDKEKMDLLEYGNVRIFTKLLELLDDIRNAEQAANSMNDIASVQKGLDMIYKKATKLFEEEGVKVMETEIGDDFDVNFHEALMRQNSELEENKIVTILQQGYIYKDKVLRYAKVATSTGSVE